MATQNSEQETEHEDAPETVEKPVAQVKEDDDGAAIVKLPETQTRKPRRERREDYQENETRKFREENDVLRRRVSDMESNFNSRLQEMQQRVPQQSDTPYDREIKNIRREQETLQATFRTGQISEADANRYRERYYELQERERLIERDRITQEVTQRLRQEQSQQQGQYEEGALRSEFPEVIANNAATRWAVGLYQQMVADGKPPTLVTSRAAMNKAAEHFGLRQAAMPAPTQSQQQRYGSVPAQAGARSQGNEIRLEPWQRKMAIARWPEDDEHIAYAKMAVLLREAAGKEGQE